MQTVKYVPMLLLPSLNSEEFITIVNLTKDEAVEFLTEFKARTDAKRTIKGSRPMTDDVLDVVQGFNLNLATLAEGNALEDLITSLSESDVPGFRGRRAVFIDVDNDILGVGTTVVYNENWASHGIVDATIAATVLNAVAEAE